jgi:hypothetical protein
MKFETKFKVLALTLSQKFTAMSIDLVVENDQKTLDMVH